jgi:hypothetical protein
MSEELSSFLLPELAKEILGYFTPNEQQYLRQNFKAIINPIDFL